MRNLTFRSKTRAVWIKRGPQGISLLIKKKDGEGDKLFVPFYTRRTINTINLLNFGGLKISNVI